MSLHSNGPRSLQKKLLVHFLLFFTLTNWTKAYAGAIPAVFIPVVSIEMFTVGRAWTWDYFRQTPEGRAGELYSSETYTVIEANGANILFEMSTVFPGQPGYRIHHRLLVPVDRCLAAYRNSAKKVPWAFRMYYRKGQRWVLTKTNNTLAFEEKFNCNGFVHDDRNYLTEFRNGEFMHRQYRRIEGSWFSADGESAAVMVTKNFSHGVGAQNYIVKRR